jgi:pyrimidine operon attenuation protein/uracil phosphoribosyltransferase
MRRSEFLRAVDTEFGARASSLVNDLVLTGLHGRTALESLTDGTPPREIWLALCAEMDVPDERRHGVGRQEPRGR